MLLLKLMVLMILMLMLMLLERVLGPIHPMIVELELELVLVLLDRCQCRQHEWLEPVLVPVPPVVGATGCCPRLFS